MKRGDSRSGAARVVQVAVATLVATLVACTATSDDTGPAPVEETGLPGVAPFHDPLGPHDEHILVSSLLYGRGQALMELTPALEPVWTHDLGEEGGAQGAVRLADGSTVYGYSGAPPNYRSRFERVDADGALVWSYDDLVTIGFVHGVGVTPGGDYVGLDTIAGDIVSFDDAGTELWRLSLPAEGRDLHPNGMSILDYGEGDVRLAVTMLERANDADRPDAVGLFRLGARDEPPEELWRIDAATADGDGAWTHGPRLLADGTLLVCHSATGQVVAYDTADGGELWRAPPTGAPSALAFPRDVLPLADGSWVLADAGVEIVRVADPRGAFEVVGATLAPGVFGLSPVTCGADGGLPCLSAP